MNGEVTVRDVMTREFVGVSEGDTVAGVADLMVGAGVDGAVVLRGSSPVGMVDASDVVELVAAGSDAGVVDAEQAMSNSVATIQQDASLREARSALATSDARRLVVLSGDEVVGTLSEHDLLAAEASYADSTPAEAPIAATAGENSDVDDRYSTQSVCEACGSLAENLANVNGQLLCADCREI